MEARDYIAKQIEALQHATTATEITENAEYFVNILKDIVSKTVELTAYRRLGTPEEIKAMQAEFNSQHELLDQYELGCTDLVVVEKNKQIAELTNRLENAVLLPCLINVSSEYAVIVDRDKNGQLYKTHTYPKQAAEVRLKELEEER